MPADTDSLIFEGEALKTLPDAPEGKVKVGAYAIRFHDSEKDFAGEFFGKSCNFGRNCGDGAMTLFNHGIPVKGNDLLADATFDSATARRDEIGIFAETILDLSDEYQSMVADLVKKGALVWSSGSAGHAMRKKSTGEITRWPISEFSFTPTPAEPRLPAIRPLKSLAEPAPIVDTPKATIKIMEKTPEQLAAERKAEIDAAVKTATDKISADFKTRREEDAEILSIGEQVHCLDAAKTFIRDGKTASDFQTYVLKEVYKMKPLILDDSGLGRDGMIGMDEKDLRRYSILKACRDMATNEKLEGVEKAAHDAATKSCKRNVNGLGFIIPDDVLRGTSVKANTIGSATGGGFTMRPDFGPMIELLRNKPRLMQAGATSLGGLVGDLYLPQQTAGATAYWVSETGALTDSNATFAQKKLSPHRLGCTIPYSTQFLAQTSLDAESWIRNDAVIVLGIEKDRAGLHGTGANGQPLGIALTPNVGAHVTYGAAATWAKVVLSETSINNANADIGEMAWMLSSATVGKWKTILRDSVAGAVYLITDQNTANGYPVFRTNQIAGNVSFFGVFSTFTMASWSGLEVIVDPYALKKSGQVEITFNELVDQLVRQPSALEVSTDTAAA